MFVTTRKFNITVKNFEYEIKVLQDKYWFLYHKNERLLKHFGLDEVITPQKTEIVAKGGPERVA